MILSLIIAVFCTLLIIAIGWSVNYALKHPEAKIANPLDYFHAGISVSLCILFATIGYIDFIHKASHQPYDIKNVTDYYVDSTVTTSKDDVNVTYTIHYLKQK